MFWLAHRTGHKGDRMSDEMSPPKGEAAGDDFLTRILDQLLDLAQTARDWVRQEAEATVKEKIVPPLQKVGLAIAASFGAVSMMVVGLIFVAVAAIVYLSQLLGVPLAFLLIGGVYLVGAAIFTFVKVRSMQR
jgi:hypothetical protein